jgi:uracil-DNA glycosylase
MSDGPEYEKSRFTCEPPPLLVAGGDVAGVVVGDVDGRVVVVASVELGAADEAGTVVVDAAGSTFLWLLLHAARSTTPAATTKQRIGVRTQQSQGGRSEGGIDLGS